MPGMTGAAPREDVGAWRGVVAWSWDADAATPALAVVQAMRMEIGRPSSSIRLSAWTATSTSVARRSRARAQPVANHLLEPAHGRLGPSPLRVAGGFLPGCPSVLGDVLQMAVALRGFGLGRLARHRRGPRRHDDHRRGMTLSDGGGNALLVVRPGPRLRQCCRAPSPCGRYRPATRDRSAERHGRRSGTATSSILPGTGACPGRPCLDTTGEPGSRPP